MNKLLSLSLFLCTIISTEFEYDESVLVLTEENFDKALEEFPVILAEFYAPWCGHCKSLAPEYAKAAQHFERENLPVKLAKIDATVHRSLAERYGVTGFPTLKFVKNDVTLDYSGGRQEADIIRWVTKKMGDASTEATLEQALEKKSDSVVVAYWGPNDANFQKFLKVASEQEDKLFVHNFDYTSIKSQPSIVLYKNFEDNEAVYQGELDDENQIKEFIAVESNPLVMGFDQQAAEAIFSGQRTTLFLLYSEEVPEQKKVLDAYAAENKGKVLFCATQVKDGFGARLGEFLGVSPDTEPLFIMIKFDDQEIIKYRMGSQTVGEFVDAVKAGTQEPFLKSEDIPAESHEDGVRVLVGKNFREVVYNEDQDVLVEFYAPWCGHCQKLAPIYSQLAEKLKDNQNIVIAKIDSTKNEVAGVSIRSFPTIKMFKRGQKDTPLDYSGNRELDAFYDYVMSHQNATEEVREQDL